MEEGRNAPRRPDGPDILPRGDRYERPPGRRQFSLKGLLWLLTISAVVLALGRLIHLSPIGLIGLLFLTVALWWVYAEIRHEPPREPAADQGALREEVEQWKQEAKGGGKAND